MRIVLCTLLATSLSAAAIPLSPIVVKAKKESSPKWQFIESLITDDHPLIPGFEEQQLQNIPGITTTTDGNPGQLTNIKIQGAPSKYTKVLWSGLSITEMEVDASFIPLSTGKVEVVKGVHCAEYGNGAIGGVMNVTLFSVPDDRDGGLKLSAGNYARSGHLWWRQKTNEGFSLQQHVEGNSFHGKNTIPQRYQTKYPTAKSPEIDKGYFLNQLDFQNHHARVALQIGLIKSASTGSNIEPFPPVIPYDSRAKRTVQIYALDLEGKSEYIQPYLKGLSTITNAQDFSPYIGSQYTRRSCSSKAKLGIKIKHGSLIFEPVGEYHLNTSDSTGEKQIKSNEYAFAQGIHLLKDTFKWKNWVRVQKAEHYSPVYAISSSLLKTYHNTEFSAHFGIGFNRPSLFELYNKKYGNKNLKKESAYGGNIGIAQHTSLGTLSVLVFKTDYKNQVAYQNRDKKYQNIKKARQEGFEVGWKKKFSTAWGIELSGMYADSVSLSPKKRLPNIPRTSANGRLSYEHDDTTMGTGWRYIGMQTQPDFESCQELKRGGYPVFFGDFQYKLKDNATWFVAVENALGRKIENPHGYRNPGFQINTGINVRW